MVYHGKQGNNVIFLHSWQDAVVFVLHSFALGILVLLSEPRQAWLTSWHLTKNISIDCVCWQLSKDCAHSWHFGSQCIFLHTKPMAYLYRNHEPWKGDVVAAGWKVYNNELWHSTEWSSGWSDWRT